MIDGDESLFSYRFGAPEKRNDADSAQHTMYSVVVNPYFDWGNDRPPAPRLPRVGHLRGPRQGPDH